MEESDGGREIFCDAVVIGGGFYGCRVALSLKSPENSVLILEQGPDLLQRASYANQARVHNGYHYPRSLLTALRSRINFDRFVGDYKDCIDEDFEKYYAVGRAFSNVSASQFKSFCQRIGAPLKAAPSRIKRLFNSDLIEEVFAVRECAFNAVKLKERIVNDLVAKGVRVEFDSKAVQAASLPDGRIALSVRSADGERQITAKRVFNCAYSQINRILTGSGLPVISLKHELTELALVEMPDDLKRIGITVVCGPFFSAMPFPPNGVHTLSHVRYTPHHAWHDTDKGYVEGDQYLRASPRKSNFLYMIRDAARYVPALKDCRYINSIWEVKTVLPQSEVDDSRPILFKTNHGLRNLTCVMGGKIDNIYDVLDEIKTLS